MACIEGAVRPSRLTYGNLSEFPARSGSRGGERGRQAVTVLADVAGHLPASRALLRSISWANEARGYGGESLPPRRYSSA